MQTDWLGDQIVMVGNYSYLFKPDGKPLEVGDEVRVPPSEFYPGHKATVKQIGSDYNGDFGWKYVQRDTRE